MEVSPNPSPDALDGITTDQLLEELAAQITPDIAPDEVTVKMLAERAHTNRDAAKRLLEGLEREGKMTRRWVRMNGGSGWAYRKTQTPSA